MKKLPLPTFFYEQQLWNQGLEFVAGVDEVGRGAFAGPVVTAAVIFSPDVQLPAGITDSKLLSPQKRQYYSQVIQESALAFAIAEVSVEVINQIGIGKSTQQAFHEAVFGLSVVPEHILIDAFYIQSIDKTIQTPIIKGDQLSVSIAAASIIAKVYRDELMMSLAPIYSEFCFGENKGYGTKAHRDVISQKGLCALHRKSFNLEKFLPESRE